MTREGDGSDPDEAPPNDEVEARPYELKPPLWQPAAAAARRGMSRWETAIVAVGVAALSAMIVFAWEAQLFATPATAMPVTITAVENISHADETIPSRITYQVSLADGTRGRLSSSQTHVPGVRLMAMVSRGRLTGRVIVSSPYVVLPEE